MKATLSEFRSTLFVALLCFVIPAAVAQAYFPLGYHHADTDEDWQISLSELLRVIQFYNSGGYHCTRYVITEDGYLPGPWESEGEDWLECCPHDFDYAEPRWAISVTELLRAIQFFNTFGYHLAPGSEDGFLPGPGPADGAGFVWQQLEATPGHVRQIELCDLDGDESPDVLVSSDEGGLEFWAYAGAGGFARHVVHGPVEDVAIIDLDDDGDADILGPHDPDLGTLWLENDGQGGFTARRLTTSDLTAGVAADFDGDGRMDIAMRRIVRTIHGTTSTWWRNDGALAFTRFDFPLDPLGESDAEEWCFTGALDFTGDLRADLLGNFMVEDFSVLFLCRNVDDTEFVCEDLTLATNSIGLASPVDFDGNGHADIVATLAHDDDQSGQRCPWLGCYFPWDETIVFENDGNGGFTERRFRLRCGTDATFYPLWTTDIDADGDVDIFMSAVHRWSPGERSFGWWEQRPGGTWVTHYIGAARLDSASTCVSDFDGDGFPDILGLNADGALGWWENQLGK